MSGLGNERILKEMTCTMTTGKHPWGRLKQMQENFLKANIYSRKGLGIRLQSVDGGVGVEMIHQGGINIEPPDSLSLFLLFVYPARS